MGLFNILNVSGSALSAQSMRLNTTASNLANADSVTGSDGKPYKAKEVVFKAVAMGDAASQGVVVSEVVESNAPMRMTYDPKNPLANGDGYVEMPNVNVVEEMVNMISASRSYQNNVEVMNTAKAMLQKAMTIGQ